MQKQQRGLWSHVFQRMMVRVVFFTVLMGVVVACGPGTKPRSVLSLPAVHRVVYVVTDRGVDALRASDGTPIWHFQAAKASPSSVSPYYGLVVGDGQAYVTFKGQLYALRANDGTVLWQYDVTRQGGELIFLAALTKGIVYTGVGFSDTISIYALRTSDGTVLWHHQVPSKSYNRSLVLSNGILLNSIDTSNQSSLDALGASDGRLLWHFPPGAGNPFPLDPVVVKDVVYVAIEDEPSASGGISVYALRASDGMVLWHTPTGPQPFEKN